MEFRLLGPLEVSHAGRTIPLGGYRQRLVLGALLLHPNRSVSTDWLVNAVWGDDPPRTARKTLQAYVARLRRSLGPGVIEGDAAGYSIRVPAERLDAARFEGLAEQGRHLLESQPPAAADLLRRALGLWRGPPWGDLGYEPEIVPEAQRLREMRLAVIEDRIRADLECGRAAALVGELQGLVEEHPYRERLWAHLLLALYRSGRQADALRAFQDARRVLGEELGIEPTPMLRDLERKILLHDPSIEGPAPPAGIEDWASARNPYKGLRPFGEEDAGDFFGRAGLVEELAARVGEQPFVAVVGASGSGKSSVIRAGLIPRLRAGSGRWIVATMVPGGDPFEDLGRALAEVASQLHAVPLTEPVGDDLDLLRTLQSLLPDDGTRLLLVIDQFEELLYRVQDDDVRNRFARNLAEAIEDPHSGLTVVATLRADFYGRAMELPILGDLMAACVVSALPLTPSELEAAAARPAAGVGVHLEPELLAELMADMADQPGALPLFQFVLTDLFERRAGEILTRSAYQKTGGLRGALARRAEETFRSLEVDQQEAARRLFLRMVTVGEGVADARRRVDREELEGLDPIGGSVAAVLEAFDGARLLTFDRRPVGGNPTVEVAHEALLGEWPRLRAWLDRAREDLRLHQSLAAAVREWEASQGDPGFLLSGSRLALYDAWKEETSLGLTEREVAFLEAGLDRQAREHAAELSRRDQELRLERRSVRRLRWLAAVVSIAALVAAGLTVLAVDRSREAAARTLEARARELANAAAANADTDPELAILLALEAIETTRSEDGTVLREAEEALHLVVNEHRLIGSVGGEWSIDFRPDGTLFVGGDGAQLLDPAAGESRLGLEAPFEGAHFEAVAVSPDGALLATGTSRRGTVTLWDAESGDAVRTMGSLFDTIASLDFSPDGTRLAAVAPGGVGRVQVWDVGTGEAVAGLSDPRVLEECCPPVRVEFSPDGSRLAVTTTGAVRILDVASSEWVVDLEGHESPTTAAAFLPDGETIVTASYDGTFRLWDATDGAQLASFEAGVGQVVSLALSGDGRRLLTGGDTGAVRLWKLRGSSAEPVTMLHGLRSSVMDLAFDPSGSIGAGVGFGGGVSLWDATEAGPGEVAALEADGPVAFDPDGRLLAVVDESQKGIALLGTDDWGPRLVLPDVAPYIGEVRPFHATEWGEVVGVAFSPDGTLLATTSHGFGVVPGALILWDTVTGERLGTLFEHDLFKGPVAFSGDGSKITAATCDIPGSTAAVWEVDDGRPVFATPSARCGQAVDLDTTGGLLAVQTAAEGEGNVRVWDTSTSDLVLTVTHLPSWIGTAEFDPSGTRLLTAGAGGTARVWEVATGDRLLSLEGHTGPVEFAMWSPDGSRIFTSSHDGTVRMWDAATGESLLVLRGHATWPFIAVDPGGRYLATTAGGVMRVWALDLDDLIEIAESRLTRTLTAAECVTYHFEECPR